MQVEDSAGLQARGHLRRNHREGRRCVRCDSSAHLALIRALTLPARPGGNCEGTIRKQSDETGATSTTVGASFMNWRGDVALGGNAQTQFNVGKDTQMTARANLNRSAFPPCLSACAH